MKKMTTIKAALAAVRTGFAFTALTSIEAGEVIFSATFPLSGHIFYTCRFYGVVFEGILHPEDTFDLMQIKPKATSCMGGYGMRTNWATCSGEPEHVTYHQQLVQKLLDKSSTFCPSRLRKFRAK